MIKFGTDGIRGLAYKEITQDLAKKLGNTLSGIIHSARILIGRDTRESGGDLEKALIEGIVDGGGTALALGIAPTPSVAFLLNEYNCDFGIVITASHNPSEYNGLKVFDKNGGKLSPLTEKEIEKGLNDEFYLKTKGGKIENPIDWENKYIDFLVKQGVSLKGKKILIDCANGAFSNIAGKVFERLNANVCVVNNKGEINRDCGALYPENLSHKVVNERIDFAFAFDGDGDRLISLDEKGKVVDGDGALIVLSNYFKEKGMLNENTVVGTVMTNLGTELELNKKGVQLIRANVGDKYILQELAKGYCLGAEQSGHVIIYNSLKTGDGCLCAVWLAKVCTQKNMPLSQLSDYERFYQVNDSYTVSKEILENSDFILLCEESKELLKDKGRIIVRASGTESKIRIMLESNDQSIIEILRDRFKSFVDNY